MARQLYKAKVGPSTHWSLPEQYQNLKQKSNFYCSAEDTKSGENVWIKRVTIPSHKVEQWRRFLREVKVLKQCKGLEITMDFRDIWTPDSCAEQLKEVYMALSPLDVDLSSVLHSRPCLTPDHVRYFTYQLLRGLKYLHSAAVVHRDLSPAALFVNTQCDLRIGDFGLANRSDFQSAYVATQQYQAPELVLDWLKENPEPDFPVDIWAAGCVLAEMCKGRPLFPSTDSIDFMHRILSVLGSVEDEFRDKMTKSAKSYMQNRSPGEHTNKLGEITDDPDALDLLNRMLILDPAKRITAEEALKHKYFGDLRDEEDEPKAENGNSFDFGAKRTIEELRKLVWEEI